MEGFELFWEPIEAQVSMSGDNGLRVWIGQMENAGKRRRSGEIYLRLDEGKR